MKIVMVTKGCCIRVLKESWVLANNGYELHVVTNRSPQNTTMYRTVMTWSDIFALREALLHHGSQDTIFHIHNEPSWMVSVVRETLPDARIVFDVHDSNYWRYDEGLWFEEDLAARCANGFVFPSSSAMEMYPNKGDKPSIFIPSANPQSEYRMGPWDYCGGLVNQGGHINPETCTIPNHWRDHTDLYKQLMPHKRVFAYSLNFKDHEDIRTWYEQRTTEAGWMSHGNLITAMGRHDWSLCGSLHNQKVRTVGLPNKFFDAMAAGVPVVNFHIKEVAKLVDKYDVGITVETVEELLDRWEEHHEKRYNVFLHRKEFAMEKFIPNLEQLYEKVT